MKILEELANSEENTYHCDITETRGFIFTYILSPVAGFLKLWPCENSCYCHTYTHTHTHISEMKNVNHLSSKDQEELGKLLIDVDVKAQVFEKSSK